MINLNYIKNQKINEIELVRILFYTFPLWFILGNLAVSLHTLIFVVISLFVIKKKELKFRFNNPCWLLVAFFLYFFLSTTVQFLNPGILNDKLSHLSLESNPIFKSLLLGRFIILIIVIDVLFFNKILELKKLLFFSLVCTTFVSFDVIIQYITGYDIFGFESFYTWNSGPFGEEKIASTYLKNFSFLSFFYIFTLIEKKRLKSLIPILIVTLHIIGIFLAGNRMPLILFIFGFILITLLAKNFRLIMTLSLLISLPIFFSIIKYDSNYNYAYKNFFSEININLVLKKNKENNDKKENIEEKIVEDEKIQDIPKSIVLLRHSGYNRVFRTSLMMWKEQPLFGFGLKSLRIKCWDMLEKDNIKRRKTLKPQYLACANHSHNYYLEFLSEAGIIGTGLLVAFFIVMLKDSLLYIRKHRQKINPEINLLLPFIIVFFLEVWPLKSSGSFFTTWGATFFWFNVAILIAFTKEKYSNLTNS